MRLGDRKKETNPRTGAHQAKQKTGSDNKLLDFRNQSSHNTENPAEHLRSRDIVTHTLSRSSIHLRI